MGKGNKMPIIESLPQLMCENVSFFPVGRDFWDAMEGGKTFHHCRNFLCNFPTLHVFSLWKCCKRVREREPLSLASPRNRMTHRSAEKPSIHLLSHSPILSPSPSQHPRCLRSSPASERRNRTAGGGNYRTAGHLFFSLVSSTPRSTFLGRWSYRRPPPLGGRRGDRTRDGWDDAKGAS